MDSLVERLNAMRADYSGTRAGWIIREAATAITTLQSELLEQARIIGKGAEREERLAARVRELERAISSLKKQADLFPIACDILTTQEVRDAKGNWRSLIDQQARALTALRQALADMEQADADQ